jgi:hypothetical protein
VYSNVIGRVRNISLPASKSLYPLFEAIINSIEAIEDVGKNLDKSYVNVNILRSSESLLADNRDDPRILGEIAGFEITDNGIGFTDLNYYAFNEADTLNKQKRGGKGVGRFLWLKAFDKVNVDSIYCNNDKIWQRSFIFSLDNPSGIRDYSLIERMDKPEIKTTVRLDDFKTPFRGNVPGNTLAISQRIIEHCLEYYILGNMPPLQVSDDSGDDPIQLDGLYEKLVAENKAETIEIKSKKFDIVHIMLNAHADLKHQIYYCGDRRVVRADKISNHHIPNLLSTLSISENDGSFVYSGYVSSDYLDERTNQQRTGFDTLPEDWQFPSEDLKWSEIEDKVFAAAKSFLQPYTEKVKVRKEEQINDYANNEAPEYRYIVANYPEKLDKIPPEFSNRELDIKLYEIHKEIETQFVDETSRLLEKGALDETQIRDHFAQWLQDWNNVGKANLARYIVNRRSVLTILEKALQTKEAGNYSKEEVIHRIIFPIKSTSNNVRYNEHNLWIIDEKLAYHEYLASDVPLKSNEKLESNSSLRPDLFLFFDRPIAVVDDEYPYNSGAVIFEFKRPMRNDYSENENPIKQIYDYVKEIRRGNEMTKDGRPLKIPIAAPIYCYLVCDITPRLEAITEQYDLKPTPDGCGYFGFNSRMGTYIEIIGFEKLVADAKKRNRILFEQLGVQGEY